MDTFVTPDQILGREQVEKIVKENAPKAYAKIGLDRLLTTAQMVEEYRLANLDEEEFRALLPHFGYYYTGRRQKIFYGDRSWMELIDFQAVGDMIRQQLPDLLGRVNFVDVCTIARAIEAFKAGKITLNELATLYAYYDMGIYVVVEPENSWDPSPKPEEGCPWWDLFTGTFPQGVYGKLLETIEHIEAERDKK